MKTINQNILTIQEGIVVQQVNAKGYMGAGLARDIRNKWEKVYTEYYSAYKKGLLELGAVIWTSVKAGLWVASIVAQKDIGRDKKKVYTVYLALKVGLLEIRDTANFHKKRVYIPYGIGCGLGNGKWGIVSKIIEETIPNAVICKLE